MEAPVAILKGCQIRRNVKIDSLPYVIGRCRTANFIIAHINVSRNHCHIVRENLLWKVNDYSSSGTYVNNELVGKKQSKILKSGDIIRFGSVESHLSWKFCVLNEFPSQSEQCGGLSSETNTLKDHTKDNTINSKVSLTETNHEGNRTKKVHQEILDEAELRVATIKYDFSPCLKHNECRSESKDEGSQKIITTPQKREADIVDSKLHERKHVVETERVHDNNVDNKLQLHSDTTKEEVKSKAIISQNQTSVTGEKSNLQKEDLQNNSFVLEKNENEKRKLKCYLPKVGVVQKSPQSLPEKSVETNATKGPCLSENLSGNDQQEKVHNDNYSCLPKRARIETKTDSKHEMEQSRSKKTEDLVKELEQLKSALNDLECKNSALKGKLAAASNSQNEVLEFKSNLLGNLADLMEDEFQCTICSELFVQAVTLGCTHTFCKFCIGEWRKKQKTCPICRKKITCETRSLVVDNYIDKMVGNLSLNLKERREAIIAERNEALHQKKS